MKAIQNAITGMRYGLIVSLVLSAWVTLLALLQGTVEVTVRGHAVNVFHLIAAYLLGCAATGAIAGGCLLLMRWRLGAMLVGVLASIPFSIAMAASLRGLVPWTERHTLLVLIGSLVIGIFGGLGLRELLRDELSIEKD